MVLAVHSARIKSIDILVMPLLVPGVAQLPMDISVLSLIIKIDINGDSGGTSVHTVGLNLSVLDAPIARLGNIPFKLNDS